MSKAIENLQTAQKQDVGIRSQDLQGRVTAATPVGIVKLI
jgi:hypothetical protein